MSESGKTLGDLIGKVDPNAVREVWRRNVEDSDIESGSFAGFVTESAAGKVAEALNGALDKDLFEVLAQAVAGVKDLLDYLDHEEYPPDKEVTKTFYETKLDAPQDIALDLVIVGLSAPISLVLTLDLAVPIETLKVTIKGGRVTAIDFGTVKAEVCLRYRKAKLIGPHSSPALHLGKRPLPEPGLAIG